MVNEISKIYNEEFFESVTKGEFLCSFDMAKIILEILKPKSIIDIGCGNGIHLNAFKECGITDYVGYDGSEVALKKSLLPKGEIILHDLRKPLSLNRKYDLCCCIEVAEHIEERYAKTLINTLVGLSDLILFTAAVPKQGGTNHVNEQPHEYWKNLFKQKGYFYCDYTSEKLRRLFWVVNINDWIYNNLMVFRKGEI